MNSFKVYFLKFPIAQIMIIFINTRTSLNQISLFFFVLILGVLPACQYKSPLPEIKKANLTIRDTKYETLEETEFGGPEEYAAFHHHFFLLRLTA